MFIIINLTELEPDSFGNERIIPQIRRPSYLHETEDAAQAELLRLSEHNPSCKFVMFAATYTARQATALVPTQVWVLEPTNLKA
jgi:hypothetical protein